MIRASLWENIRARMRGTIRALRANLGEIAYCGGIALMLIALAAGAERYRQGRTRAPEPASIPTVDFAATDSTAVPDSAEAPEAEALSALPEGAQLLRGYSAAPGWNAELKMWESHPASDYLLPGDDVTCLLAGTVRAVEFGGTLGGFVEVDSDGAVLRYASIRPRANLRLGDEIEAGEAIGDVDVSMPGEASLGPHLHLELIADGASADFSEWAERVRH